MLSVDLGAVVSLTWTSATGGAASLTLTAPDGTTAAGTVTDAGTTHTGTFTAGKAGRWLASWATDAEVYTDVVDVWPADPRFLISVADAKAACNLSTVDVARDDELRLYIAAATPVIEDICGPVLAGTRTQVANGRKSAILLHAAPVTNVAVEVDGMQIDPDDLTVNEQAGVVTVAGRDFGGDLVTVTYTAGAAILPPNLRLATRELVRFLWQIGKQGARPTTQQQDSAQAWTPSGFAVPKRVIELCAPNMRVGGFA